MTERERTRKAAWRLAIIRHAQEVTGNVAFTCRHYGIPRPSYYKWLRRYEELGEEGLRDRSRRPLVSPHATKAAVVDRIIDLRQHYHFGPLKISMYLKRIAIQFADYVAERLPFSSQRRSHLSVLEFIGMIPSSYSISRSYVPTYDDGCGKWPNLVRFFGHGQCVRRRLGRLPGRRPDKSRHALGARAGAPT